jgi:hypothetical protein
MTFGTTSMVAFAEWELRDTADKNVTAARATNNLRMCSFRFVVVSLQLVPMVQMNPQ